MMVLLDEIYLIKAAISTIFYLGICCQFTFKYYAGALNIKELPEIFWKIGFLHHCKAYGEGLLLTYLKLNYLIISLIK